MRRPYVLLGVLLAACGSDDEPGQSQSPGTVIELQTGGAHVCVRLESGAVRCFGSGVRGQLGYGNGDDAAPSTKDVQLGGEAISISVGDLFSCAVLSGGGVRCWGDAGAGVLGQGNLETVGDDEVPADVPLLELPAAKSVAAGKEHACALLEDGSVRCWGTSRFLGTKAMDDVGDDETLSATQPVELDGPATQLCAGFFHSCALTESGSVFCWGGDSAGPLGKDGALVGVTNTPLEAGPVDLPGKASAVYCGFLTTCAELADGLYCWGEQSGSSDPNATSPEGPWFSDGVVASAGGRDFQCAASAGGDVGCWSVRGSQLVAKTLPDAPVMLPFEAPMMSLSAGRDSICGVTADRHARCVGPAPGGVGEGENIHVE
ncbi:MAG: hypothetical protein R3B89_26240 [Polyangiaceae bacterium]